MFELVGDGGSTRVGVQYSSSCLKFIVGASPAFCFAANSLNFSVFGCEVFIELIVRLREALLFAGVAVVEGECQYRKFKIDLIPCAAESLDFL